MPESIPQFRAKFAAQLALPVSRIRCVIDPATPSFAAFVLAAKQQCDFSTLLRFCAYAFMQNIPISTAVERLQTQNVGYKFPSELYKRSLEVLEERNSAPAVLLAIHSEREKLFPEAAEDRKRLAAVIAESRGAARYPAISKPPTPPSSSPLTVPTVDSSPPASSKKRAAPADNGRVVRQRVESPPPTPVPTVPLRSPAHSNLPTLPDSSLPPQGSTVSKIAAVSAEETVQELIFRLMAEGHELDEKTFWAKLMNTHQQIVAKLNAEEAKSRGYTEEIVRLRSDEDSLATRNARLQAEVNVERARADMLATQVQALGESSAKVTDEFRAAMDRTKELEMKLAEREPPPSNPPSTAKLQQTIQLLQRTISKLQTELGTVNRSFTGLSSRYSELLRRNDYVVDNNRILFRDSTELQTQLAEKKREIDMLGSLLVQAVGEALSPVVEELQADRRHLQQERKIALELPSRFSESTT
ncbi:hypothetical protein BDP27DRAFT_1426192 [Rhodocollybia butyracea]|uniref:Uncharacterized protein n=1 Tax=Rhodocollybia butyracea TaxID=206335 RepID=A0A9P5PF13_9AGAR|nr:hypothetical protein BDP27DRAFT_1426192 [Rhodocollybia butyracea]